MRRTFLTVLFLAILLIPTSALAKTKITWMEWPRPNQDQLVAKLLAAFHEQNPDIEVTYRPMTSEDQVSIAMAAGTSPDVIGFWGDGLISWMEAGALLNLDPYLDQYGFEWDDFNPMQLKAFSTGGSQYILPHYLGTSAMYYNKNHFAEAGIPNPDSTWTWDDRREVGRKLTIRQDGNIVRWGNMFPVTSLDRWANLVTANGGIHHPEGDNSIVLWDRPEAIEAMEYWRTMLFEDESAPRVSQLLNSDYRATFVMEMVTMYETLPIDLAHYGSAEFEIGITQNPTGPVQRVALATLDGYGIWSGSPNTDAALKFLMYLVSPEANQLRAQLQSLQPARRSVLTDWVDITLASFPFVTREDVMQFYFAGEYAEPMPSFSNPQVATRTLRQAISRIYTNNEPAAVVMAEMIPVLNAQLKR